ncbi:MAG: hypothetical protein ACK55I_00355, partial [bacterium]
HVHTVEVVEPFKDDLNLIRVGRVRVAVLILRRRRGEVGRHGRARIDHRRVDEPVAHPVLAQALAHALEVRGPGDRVRRRRGAEAEVALEAVDALHGDGLAQLEVVGEQRLAGVEVALGTQHGGLVGRVHG